MHKEAMTQHPVHSLIRKRWSPRSFSAEPVSQEDLNTLLEAASWAASSGNEQPWQYVYAFHGTDGFATLWNCLDGGNQPWTKNAAVLMASIRRTVSEKTQKPNALSMHDTGMANATLFLQAVSMDIYPHPMAGFHKDKLKEALSLNDTQEPVCMIALGYLDSPDKLEEPFRSRETAPRTRKHFSEFARML